MGRARTHSTDARRLRSSSSSTTAPLVEADSGEDAVGALLFLVSARHGVLATDDPARRGSSTARSSSSTRAIARPTHLRAASVPAHPREAALSDEVVELLQELIRLDTVNPPGNETTAAELLRDLPRGRRRRVRAVREGARAGEPRRPHPRHAATGRACCFLSHTDTVLADPAEWSTTPGRASCATATVWGRGALDMKGQVAASAVAIASLAREGFAPAATSSSPPAADEEVGDGFGLQWLVEAAPRGGAPDYAVNEGAGDRVELGGARRSTSAPRPRR